MRESPERGADRAQPGMAALLQRAGPLALAGVASNGLGVVLTVALARLLDERAYGAYASLLGLFLVLSMPGSALVVAVVRKVSELEASGRASQVDPWAASMRRRLAAAAAVAAVAGFALRGEVATALSLPGPGGITEVVAAAGCWALLGFERGVLQARRRYGVLARNLLVEAGVRTIATGALVAAGLGVAGAAAGVLLADAVAAVHARARARRPVAADLVAPPGAVPADAATGGRMGSDAVAAFAVLALLAVLQTVDVLVVGREAPDRSGSYAAISVTSKALVFVGFSLSQYLLPEAARRFSEGRHALRQLGVCLGLLAVPAAVLLAVAVVAPERLLSTVFGADLVGAAPALATLVLATASLATAVLFAYYLLGAARRSVVAVLATAAAVATVALQAADGEALATARTVLACNAVMAGVLGVMVVRTSRAATAAPAVAAASTA